MERGGVDHSPEIERTGVAHANCCHHAAKRFQDVQPPGHSIRSITRVVRIDDNEKDPVAQRDAWLNPPGLSEQELQKRTLTNLYNVRPDWLTAAHRRLDAAVFAAYGWPEDLADEEMLARLLALNLERAG